MKQQTNETGMKKNMLWNAAGNLIYLVSQWVVTVLVTVIGGLTDAGILSVAMSVSASFQTVAMFGIRSFQVSDREGKYTDTCYTGLRVLTCSAALVLCILFSLINGYLGRQLLAIILFMLFRLAECFSDVLHGIAQRCNRLDIAGKAFTVKGIGLLICFLAGYWLSGLLNVGLLSMALFSVASTLCYDLPAVHSLSDFHLLDTFSHCKSLAAETLPLCLYLFLSTLLTTVPRLILEKQCGETVLGAYASISAPVMILQAAAGYLYQPFAPEFARFRQERASGRFYRLLIKLLLVVFAIFVALLIAAQFLGEFALVLVFGEQIREYVYLLQPILWCNIAVSYLGLLSMVVIVLRRFRWLIAGYAAGFLCVLLLTAPAIQRFGANGTSYGLIFAGAITMIVLACGIFYTVQKWEKG